jgi:hypothetical protein
MPSNLALPRTGSYVFGPCLSRQWHSLPHAYSSGPPAAVCGTWRIHFVFLLASKITQDADVARRTVRTVACPV